jgi:Flp pilus assembly protein TadD
MKSVSRISAVILAVWIFTGCAGLEKMKKNAGLIRFKVNPEVLETKAGKVDVAVTGTFPQVYFQKKATLEITPVLQYAGGETPLPVVNLQGEKINANNRVIPYNSGGNFSYKQNFPYRDDMRNADLTLKMKARKGKKSLEFEPVVVAKGILATSTMMAGIPRALPGIRREANNTGIYNPAVDPFQRIVPQQVAADIYYLINSSDLRKTEIKSDPVKNFLDYTKKASGDKSKEVKKVEVVAYASPDGSLEMNTNLAADREKATTGFVEGELKDKELLEKLRTKYMPEDWEGFKELMQKSKIQDKELILRVLDMYTNPEVREKQIRNLTEVFTQIKDEILPKLRRAKLYTSVELIGKSDEELLTLAESNPGSLNQAELLYAATLTDDPARKLKIYNSFCQVFPTDWRGPNNVGYVLAGQFKYSEARPYFEKAEKLKGSEPIVKNNLGTVALMENNLSQAEEYFGIASGVGEDVNYNLGLLSIQKGDYLKANQYFGSMADPNTALAKLLTGNYPGALRDLEKYQQPNSYLKEYLKAVIGARTNNEALFFESLRNAVTYNPACKAKARTDREFAGYFDNSRFREITR